MISGQGTTHEQNSSKLSAQLLYVYQNNQKRYIVTNASSLPFTDNLAYFEVACPAVLIVTQQYIPL